MLADIVVLAADVFTNPPVKAATLVVDTTIFDGRIVYERSRVDADRGASVHERAGANGERFVVGIVSAGTNAALIRKTTTCQIRQLRSDDQLPEARQDNSPDDRSKKRSVSGGIGGRDAPATNRATAARRAGDARGSAGIYRQRFRVGPDRRAADGRQPRGRPAGRATAAQRSRRAAGSRRHGAEPDVILSNLTNAHSLAFKDGWLYVATTPAVVRVRWANGAPVGEPETVVDLPSSTPSVHVSRTINFGPDGRLYVAIGSSCNVCVEADPRRTTIQVVTAGRHAAAVRARPAQRDRLRLGPADGPMWAGETGQDNLGDDFPPDEIDLIEAGKHYGFPFFIGRESVPTSVSPS